MNYFGLIFSFALPGMVLGAMAALAAVEMVEARERRRARRRKRPLYIENLKEEIR
jgi:hypothetical protein|nr:MAG TPA: PufQ cytochrome subunit [Caudoviricetes sp.]